MLRVENLTVNYGKMRAVGPVSFEVKAGEFVGILGANGAGKTTLLKALLGLLPQASGRVTFDEKKITAWAAPARIRAGLALVPEGRQVFPGMTVMNNLELAYYAAHPREKDGARLRTELDRMFALFPRLHERRDQLAGSLSGGEQQMVALARGLLAQPRLLMLDEPSLGLAPVIVDQLLDVLVRLNAEGLTILMVEQDAYRTLEVAQRCLVLVSGNIALEGATSQLQASQEVRTAFFGK